MWRVVAVAASIIRPPPIRTVSTWADQERVLPPESPEPGKFRSRRTPFMIPALDCFTDHRYKMIIVVCGAQMGKTENVFNVIGRAFSDKPTPTLFIGATEKMVRSMSQDRIDKMLKTTPRLWERLEKSSERNKVTEKFIAGVRLGFGWAGSPAELSSHPAGLVLLDEVDRFDSDAGGEGDPVLLAKARTKNYSGSKIGCFSTPTIEGGSKIWALWESGTMGRWSIPCPHCKAHFIPELKLLRWKEKATPEQARETARLVCPECGGEMTTEQKEKANQGGRYIYFERDDDNNYIRVGFDPLPNQTASFQISGICSPWVTLGELAYTLLTAYRSGDPGTIQAAVNTYGGELYKVKGDAPDLEEARQLIGGYEPRTIPVGVQLITLGADIQKYGIYYTIRGWGFNSESWKIDSGYLSGETKYKAVFLLLGAVLSQDLEGRRIDRAFIDSGYNTDNVYQFCRKYNGIAYPAKGRDSLDKSIKAVKIDISHAGKTIRNGLTLWHIDTDYYKTWLYSRIRWDQEEPGALHLDNATDDDYINQITSEELVIKPSGRRVWIQTKKDNHYLDCEVYASGAASSLQVHTLSELKGEKAKSVIQEKRKNIIKKPSRGFARQG